MAALGTLLRCSFRGGGGWQGWRLLRLLHIALRFLQHPRIDLHNHEMKLGASRSVRSR